MTSIILKDKIINDEEILILVEISKWIDTYEETKIDTYRETDDGRIVRKFIEMIKEVLMLSEIRLQLTEEEYMFKKQLYVNMIVKIRAYCVGLIILNKMLTDKNIEKIQYTEKINVELYDEELVVQKERYVVDVCTLGIILGNIEIVKLYIKYGGTLYYRHIMSSITRNKDAIFDMLMENKICIYGEEQVDSILDAIVDIGRIDKLEMMILHLFTFKTPIMEDIF